MCSLHVPVLVDPIVSSLIEPFLQLPKDSEPFYLLDCTLGGGGHSQAFLERFCSDTRLERHRIIGIDQDLKAVLKANERFKEPILNGKMEIYQSHWGNLSEIIKAKPILGLVADLGFSSDQIEDDKRGLSFKREGPLDMRMDQSRRVSASELLQNITEKDLADLLWVFGEEPFSKQIAAHIIRLREQKNPIHTTSQLVSAVIQATPKRARHGRIHRATQTFQALRIAVNDEINELECLLSFVAFNLQKRGRAAVISFHSIEDRNVKNAFKNKQIFKKLTAKPIYPSLSEMNNNPRSRSAKLRIVERL